MYWRTDSDDFINKTKNLKEIPKNALLVTADVVVLYLSIPHEAGLIALKQALDKRKNRNTATNDLIRLVLKNNHFEFNGQVKQQISGTAVVLRLSRQFQACLFFLRKRFCAHENTSQAKIS